MIARQHPAARLALEWSGSQLNQLEEARGSAAPLPETETFSIGVCGCHPGAGATTAAQNLALMLHERCGEPVLLVEGNVRNPVLAVRSGVVPASGLADFARGEERLSIVPDAVQRGVSLMPSTGEVMALPLLRRATARLPALRDRFRHVLVDLPPVLAFPEAAALGASLDGVVLVIEAEATPWGVARRAKKRLEAGRVKLLGVVLNKKQRVIPDWLYRRI